MTDDSIDLVTKIEILSKQAVFASLNDEEKEILATILIEKHFEPHEVIVREGDPVDSVYLVVKGTADVIQSINNNPQNVHTVAQIGSMEAIGLNETGFYSISGIRTATVKAISPMVTLRMSVAAFHGFALAYPHVNEVMRKNASRILMA